MEISWPRVVAELFLRRLVHENVLAFPNCFHRALILEFLLAFHSTIFVEFKLISSWGNFWRQICGVVSIRVPVKWIPFDSPWRALQIWCSVRVYWTKRLAANSRKLTAGKCAIFRYLRAFRQFATERLLGSSWSKKQSKENFKAYRMVCVWIKSVKKWVSYLNFTRPASKEIGCHLQVPSRISWICDQTATWIELNPINFR